MSRLSSLAVVSIDRSINSRANRMDLRNADLALGRFFPIDLFPLKKKDLRAFSTNNVRTSRNRRLKTTIYTLPEPVAETTFFFVVALFILKEKKRALFVYKSRFHKTHLFFFWKNTHTHKKNLCLFESLNNPMIDLGYQYLEALVQEREREKR